MKLLKRENWWIWLLMFLFSGGTSHIVLGALLDVYDKNAWYAKLKYWIIGIILFLIPFSIMVPVFILSITCNTAYKLKLDGSEYYMSPYVWLFLLIIPFIGWLVFVVLLLYINIGILGQLYKGYGEKYI